LKASASVFGSIEVPEALLPGSTIPRGIHSAASDESVPSSLYKKEAVVDKVLVIDLLTETQLCKSKSDARRLVKQGGAYINGERITGFDQLLTASVVEGDEILLRAGKKKYHKIIFE